MSEHAYELPIGEPAKLDRLTEEAEGGEVVYLTRGGRRVFALVPVNVADVGLAALRAMEDAEGIAAADAAMDEPGESIPWEQIKTEAGL